MIAAAALAPTAPNPMAAPALPIETADPGAFARELSRADAAPPPAEVPAQRPAAAAAAKRPASSRPPQERARRAAAQDGAPEDGAAASPEAALAAGKDLRAGTALPDAAAAAAAQAAPPAWTAQPQQAALPAADAATASTEAGADAIAPIAEPARADALTRAAREPGNLRAADAAKPEAAQAEAAVAADERPRVLAHDTRDATDFEPQAATEAAPALPAAPPAEAVRPQAAAVVALPAAAAERVPAELQLSTPFGSPEFALGLGNEVAILVRDGVQHARLHLHPAEMGPITVQIALEGQAAQVNLAAENQQTRQALEQALPTLAACMRENGLTLSGGGVFEQPRQPRDEPPSTAAGAPRERGGDAAAAPATAAAPARVMRARGVVDLYA